MRLDDFVTFIREQTKQENPNIIFMADGFSFETLNYKGNNLEVSHRSEWYDDSLFGNKVRKGDFYIVEIMEPNN